MNFYCPDDPHLHKELLCVCDAALGEQQRCRPICAARVFAVCTCLKMCKRGTWMAVGF